MWSFIAEIEGQKPQVREYVKPNLMIEKAVTVQKYYNAMKINATVKLFTPQNVHFYTLKPEDYANDSTKN